MKRIWILLLCILSIISSKAYAGTIVVPEISKFEVGGDDMDGMLVSVNFADGVKWVTTGFEAGGASGKNANGDTVWSLSFSGLDTWAVGGEWIFWSTREVSSLSIDAYAGGIVFDILDDTERTDGSKWGYFELLSFTGSTTPFFDNEVKLMGDTWKEDLYGKVTFTFNTPHAFTLDDPFKFGLDTDAVIPEPTTILLLGVGLIGLTGVGAKRRKVKTA
jgi:hypothetical protein